MRWPHLWTLALLAACKDGQITLDDSGADSPLPDSEDSAPDDSGGDSGGDSGEDSDPGEPTTLTFTIEGPWSGTGLELVRAADFDSEDPFLDTFAAGAVGSAAPSLVVYEPPEAHKAEVEGVPGLIAAFYAPAIFDDLDGDGARGEDEPYGGVSAVWALWLEGSIPTELLIAGLKPGWNAAALFAEEGAQVVYDTSAIPLPSNLWAQDRVDIGGTVAAEVSAAGSLGVVVLPVSALNGGLSAGVYADEPITDAWSTPFEGEPPALDEVPAGEWFIEGAAYLPLGYVDADGSGAWDEADTAVFPVCAGDAVVVVQYAYPPTRMLTAWGMSTVGWHAGWGVIAVSADDSSAPALLSEAEATALVIGSGCALE